MKKSIIMAIFMVLVLSLLVLISLQNEKVQATQEKTEEIISITELAEQLGNSDLVIVDVRREEAYNGWKLDGEVRGGHIRGAVDFPLSWNVDDKGNKINEKELKVNLESKGITQDKTIVVYDNKGDKSPVMLQILKELGYANVFLYKEGITKWAANVDLPMERLANYEKLVYPAWINELVHGGTPKTYPKIGELFQIKLLLSIVELVGEQAKHFLMLI
ncbi:MAG: hypothetical protein KAX49_04160 [Halanaerobiales bacterium]|nr:hypothetical protein [Halanaerobiales bacterium]